MTFNSLLSFFAALFCSVLASFVFFRDRHSFVHRIFVFGMVAVAIEALLNGLSFQAVTIPEVIRWQSWRFVATAFLPTIWVLFSLTFGRANYKEIVGKWQWPLIAGFIFPLVLISIFGKFFFIIIESSSGGSSGWLLRLGWSGYLFYLYFLICAVLILMSLERTFRGSAGGIRWQIKFMILGIGSLFACRIYSASQSLLFSAVSANLEMFNVVSVILANILTLFSFTRLRILNVDIYLSQRFIYNSFVVLIVGVYLISVGILAKVVRHLNISENIPLEALFIFLMLVGLTVVLFSDELRQDMKKFISLHFRRPHYDYREKWREFTKRTSLLMDTRNLCAAVSRMLSETFGVSSATIWLLDETNERLTIGGSTVFSQTQAQGLAIPRKEIENIIRIMGKRPVALDLKNLEKIGGKELREPSVDYFQDRRIRCCAQLTAGGEFLGLMTLNDRITGEPFSLEDLDLLQTVADQTAGSLLNLKLSANLHRAKEMEAFQTMSTFFVHDLKNLGSKLSLTVQNLPIHFDNAEFRNDAIRTISESLAKINGMCSRLSSLNQKLELQRTEGDLNELVKNTVSSLNSCFRTSLVLDLHPVAKIYIDPEQMQRVLVNLILNANEAITNRGEIKVATMPQDGFIVLAVNDNGCGMSQEFIRTSLFRPFKTTKKQGMGIGLYQSKMIVEAHGGRIEVESEEGRGTTFRVFLPMAGK